MGIQDKNTKNSIKSNNYPKRKTMSELENLRLIDWYIVIKPSLPCSGRKEHIRKDVCRLNSKPASTTDTQIEYKAYQEMLGPFMKFAVAFQLFIVHLPFKYCQKGIKKKF